MPSRNALLISLCPFLTNKPSGAGYYNLLHMEHLRKQRHQCAIVCPLTAGSRSAALAELHSKNVKVATQEHRSYFMDSFCHRGVEIHAVTDRSKHWEKLAMFPLNRVRSHRGSTSTIPRSHKSLLEMLRATFVHGDNLQKRYRVLLNWFISNPYTYLFSELAPELMRIMKSFGPDYVFVDAYIHLVDFTLYCLSQIKDLECKVILIVTFSNHLPFGPMAYFREEQFHLKASSVKDVFGRIDGYITLSNYLKNYLKTWSGLPLDPQVVYPRIRVPPDVCSDRSGRRGFVTLINACNEKGLPIFLELAKRLPDVSFAAVTTWGYLPERQRKQLEQLPNVQILKSMSPIDPLYDITRVLLVPSLWDEGFGMVVTEAMLRGIPVLASNVGGLPEAKLGIDYVLPVQPYRSASDYGKELSQDIEPWLNALSNLVSSTEQYQLLSDASQAAACSFISRVDETSWIDVFERH